MRLLGGTCLTWTSPLTPISCAPSCCVRFPKFGLIPGDPVDVVHDEPTSPKSPPRVPPFIPNSCVNCPNPGTIPGDLSLLPGVHELLSCTPVLVGLRMDSTLVTGVVLVCGGPGT